MKPDSKDSAATIESNGQANSKREHEWVWCCDMCGDSYCRVCYTTWSEEDNDENCEGELK